MKPGLIKIISITLLSLLLLLIPAVGIYVYRPTVVYRGITFITLKVMPSQSYDTKYGVHPYLEEKIESVIREARLKGIDLRVVEGYRSPETQRKYYEQGRTKKGGVITYAPPGMSYHNHGWAVDVCEYVDGQPNWKSEHWDEIGDLGKKHGLVWGGDWKRLVDRPHFQLSRTDILRYVLF